MCTETAPGHEMTSKRAQKLCWEMWHPPKAPATQMVAGANGSNRRATEKDPATQQNQQMA